MQNQKACRNKVHRGKILPVHFAYTAREPRRGGFYMYIQYVVNQ